MKKTKRFNEGGMSLEEKYPEAKITRAGPQPKPVEEPPKSRLQEVMREAKDAEYKNMSKKAELAPYEQKAEKFQSAKSKGSARGGAGGGGGIIPLDKRTPYFKKGGKVSSVSNRADGCCVKGKTRGKMM